MAPRSPRALGDDPDSVVALVVHKPRGHVSERFPPGVSRDPLGRPSAYELLPRSLDPGASSLGAVGRLDAETSGLLVFTSSPALNLALRAGGVAKTYVATVGARRLSDARLARAVASAEIPLTRRDDDRAPDAEAWTKPATARLLGRRVARRLAEDAAEDAATDAAEDSATDAHAATEPPTREPLPPASAASRVGDPFAEPFAAEEHWRRHRANALGLRASDDLLADRFEVAEVEIATRDGMNVGGSARLLIGRRSFSSRTRLFFERVYERGNGVSTGPSSPEPARVGASSLDFRARRRISPHPIHTSLGPPFSVASGFVLRRPRAHTPSRSPADPRVRSTAMAFSTAARPTPAPARPVALAGGGLPVRRRLPVAARRGSPCLLYTSDAADE